MFYEDGGDFDVDMHNSGSDGGRERWRWWICRRMSYESRGGGNAETVSVSRLPPPTRLPPHVPGSRIEVYWPLDQRFYAGTVVSNRGHSRKEAGGRMRVNYNNGEEVVVDLKGGAMEVCR